MLEKRKNFMFKSTYEILEKRIKLVGKKLNEDIPKDINECYNSGGYWHDNPGWDEALREQRLLRRELNSLRDALKNPIFIEELVLDKDKVTLGKKIKVKDLDTQKVNEYVISGTSDVSYNFTFDKENLISCNAPFAKPLIGKSVGEKILVDLPMAKKNLMIVGIKNFIEEEKK
jgi:transcription elongation factor GreA